MNVEIQFPHEGGYVLGVEFDGQTTDAGTQMRHEKEVAFRVHFPAPPDGTTDIPFAPPGFQGA